MHQHNISRDRKSESASACLSRARLVDAVKTLKNAVLRLLRNSDSRVRYLNIKEFVVGIERHPHPAILLVVLDRIFHKVRDRKRELHLIYIRSHLADALKNQLDFLFVCDRTQTL